MDAPEKRRWYCPTPGWLVLGSLAVTGLIWLSNWLGWPAWHKGYAVLVAVAGVGVVLAAMLLWWLVALVFRWRFQFSTSVAAGADLGRGVAVQLVGGRGEEGEGAV